MIETQILRSKKKSLKNREEKEYQERQASTIHIQIKKIKKKKKEVISRRRYKNPRTPSPKKIKEEKTNGPFWKNRKEKPVTFGYSGVAQSPDLHPLPIKQRK